MAIVTSSSVDAAAQQAALRSEADRRGIALILPVTVLLGVVTIEGYRGPECPTTVTPRIPGVRRYVRDPRHLATAVRLSL